MAQQDNPYLTITLTDRRPAKILKADWPVVAGAEDSKHDNQYECQANHKAKWSIRVRRHADGRCIVYAIYDYDSCHAGESLNVRGGELVEVGGNLTRAIHRVADNIEQRLARDPKTDQDWGVGVFPRLAHECIADLPAEEL